MTSNSTDPLIGRLIDGRYQVRSRIARGGMATVYLATDLRLERRVALKVMHGHLADDNQYKARFIQEARSAARLAHPNVVNVYDQGQDADTAYLVMEYLPGITLRDLLNEHPVLTTEQTLDIMEAILSGLAAAHRNGIVHRDLKPENVLLADDGRIKIGDFGLARAVSTQTAAGNALLGTIAYLSPELVTRGIADARSDIYAVGIMLYEMLAGEQPFKGEQPFQIAQQHANSSVPTPSTKNNRIPAELDELVLWATARDPEQRPLDAKAMLEQVQEARRLLVSPGETSTMQTSVMPAAPLVATEAETQVLGSRVRQRTGPQTFDSTTTLAKRTARRHGRGRWIFAVIAILAILAGTTGWYFGSGPGSKVVVPEVSGSSISEARAVLEEARLTVAGTQREEFSVMIAEGMVIGTDPEAGVSVASGGTVTLIVSKGPNLIDLPTLVGQTEDVARASLGEKFKVQESNYLFKTEIPDGIVISAAGVDRAGETVDLATLTQYWEGQPVTLTVSLGPVPEVKNLSVEDAKDALAKVGLVGVTSDDLHDWSDEIPKGSVIGVQVPDGIEVTKGTELQIIVSDGVEQIKVPDVMGWTWDKAKPELEAAGFVVKLDDFTSRALAAYNPAEAVVISLSPEAGVAADKGFTIKVKLDEK